MFCGFSGKHKISKNMNVNVQYNAINIKINFKNCDSNNSQLNE